MKYSILKHSWVNHPLVFLIILGQEEIENTARQCRLIAKEFPDSPKLLVS